MSELLMLKMMAKWCQICGGMGKDPRTGGFSISPTGTTSTPTKECPHCQEPRALIKKLEEQEAGE